MEDNLPSPLIVNGDSSGRNCNSSEDVTGSSSSGENSPCTDRERDSEEREKLFARFACGSLVTALTAAAVTTSTSSFDHRFLAAGIIFPIAGLAYIAEQDKAALRGALQKRPRSRSSSHSQDTSASEARAQLQRGSQRGHPSLSPTERALAGSAVLERAVTPNVATHGRDRRVTAASPRADFEVGRPAASEEEATAGSSQENLLLSRDASGGGGEGASASGMDADTRKRATVALAGAADAAAAWKEYACREEAGAREHRMRLRCCRVLERARAARLEDLKRVERGTEAREKAHTASLQCLETKLHESYAAHVRRLARKAARAKAKKDAAELREAQAQVAAKRQSDMLEREHQKELREMEEKWLKAEVALSENSQGLTPKADGVSDDFVALTQQILPSAGECGANMLPMSERLNAEHDWKTPNATESVHLDTQNRTAELQAEIEKLHGRIQASESEIAAANRGRQELAVTLAFEKAATSQLASEKKKALEQLAAAQEAALVEAQRAVKAAFLQSEYDTVKSELDLRKAEVEWEKNLNRELKCDRENLMGVTTTLRTNLELEVAAKEKLLEKVALSEEGYRKIMGYCEELEAKHAEALAQQKLKNEIDVSAVEEKLSACASVHEEAFRQAQERFSHEIQQLENRLDDEANARADAERRASERLQVGTNERTDDVFDAVDQILPPTAHTEGGGRVARGRGGNLGEHLETVVVTRVHDTYTQNVVDAADEVTEQEADLSADAGGTIPVAGAMDAAVAIGATGATAECPAGGHSDTETTAHIVETTMRSVGLPQEKEAALPTYPSTASAPPTMSAPQPEPPVSSPVDGERSVVTDGACGGDAAVTMAAPLEQQRQQLRALTAHEREGSTAYAMVTIAADGVAEIVEEERSFDAQEMSESLAGGGAGGPDSFLPSPQQLPITSPSSTRQMSEDASGAAAVATKSPVLMSLEEEKLPETGTENSYVMPTEGSSQADAAGPRDSGVSTPAPPFEASPGVLSPSVSASCPNVLPGVPIGDGDPTSAGETTSNDFVEQETDLSQDTLHKISARAGEMLEALEGADYKEKLETREVTTEDLSSAVTLMDGSAFIEMHNSQAGISTIMELLRTLQASP